MHIDFHHAVTYVVARIAGFDHNEADIVAYCSQYVDDATNTGTITFDNNAMYSRISSAHQMFDARNLNNLANHQVWLPFHFLPGNGGMQVDKNPSGGFIEKIVCCPDSPVAEDMIQACIADKETAYGLHRLGITMHVFADTWAHQGFAGVEHAINCVSKLDDVDGPEKSVWRKLKEKVKDQWNRIVSKVLKNFPLGHGCALTYPDLPYLKWGYINCKGEKIERNNADAFLAAADAMCRAMQCYRNVAVNGIPESEKVKIREMFSTINEENADKRHAKWLAAIGAGNFSFGPQKLSYQAKGPDSWKCKALGTKRDIEAPGETFKYQASFLESDWKMFHDALQAHRFAVIYDILPRYGICAA